MSSTSITVKNFRTEIPGKLSEDMRTWEFPLIKGKNVGRKDTFWQVKVRMVDVDGHFHLIDESYFDSWNACPFRGWINVESGLVGGKTREVVPTIVRVGKNVTRSNATNTFTQALRDAYSMHNKHMQKSAISVNVATAVLVPPMLAKSWDDRGGSVVITAEHPVGVQRKFNGVRAVAKHDDVKTVVMFSRKRKPYPTFPYITREIAHLLSFVEGDLSLDGELYKHGANLQDISGYTRRELRDDTLETRINYMIYDCVANTPCRIVGSHGVFAGNNLEHSIPSIMPESKWIARNAFLQELFRVASAVVASTSDESITYVQCAETWMCDDFTCVQKLYKQFLVEEYEGAMIRLDEAYVPSHNDYHSSVLLKLKPIHDAEYTIVGWTTGRKGKGADAVLIECTTSGGKKFTVTPAMEIVERNALARQMSVVEENGATHFDNQWKGKPLIVYYEELSKDKVPARATTKMEIRTWD